MKICRLTEEHIGRILKCYYKDGSGFIQYEYIFGVNDWGHYSYVPWRKVDRFWGCLSSHSLEDPGGEHRTYTDSTTHWCWERVSDLELVVLGIPFPENYVRESDRTK